MATIASKVGSRSILEMTVIRKDGTQIPLGVVCDSKWGFFKRWKEKRRMKKLLGKQNIEIGRTIKNGKRGN